MPHLRLLERFRATEDGQPEPAGASDIYRSICGHLEKIFMVRRGNSPSCPGLGGPAFEAFLSRSDMPINLLYQEITETIKLYEPRLKDITVESAPNKKNALDPHFIITARMLAGKETKPVSLHMVRFSEGLIKVW